MHSCVQVTAASTATTAATAAANSRSRPDSALLQARAASQAAAAASSATVSIRAQRCLTAWNWPIGRPNCCRTRAYPAAVCTAQSAMPHASAASRVAARLVTDGAGQPGQDPVGRHGQPAGLQPGHWPAQVQAAQRGHVQPVGVHRRPYLTAGGPHWHDHQVGLAAAEHRAAAAIQHDRAARAGHLAGQRGQRDGPGPRSVGQAGQQLAQPPGSRAVRHQCRAGQHGGQEGAGREGAAQFLGGDGQFLDPVALATVLLGQVQAEQALSGQRAQQPVRPAAGVPAGPSAAARRTPAGACRAAQSRTDWASSRCSAVIPRAMIHLAYGPGGGPLGTH